MYQKGSLRFYSIEMTDASMSAVPRKLWIVSELYHPEDNTTGFYMTRLSEGLARHGDVSVICGQPNYHRRGQRAPKRQRLNSVDIFRVWSTTLDKDIPVFKLLNMFTLSLSCLVSVLRLVKKGERVLVVTAPPTLLFAGGIGALLRRASYTLLIHDNYPEMLVAAGAVSPTSFIARAYDFFNRWLYKYAEKVIVVGRDMRKTAERKLEGLDVPVHVIPNWAELESVHPTPRESNTLLKELGLTEKFVVLYAGNMGQPQDVESVWEASRLLENDPRVHFLFIGSGTKRKKLAELLHKQTPKNVTLLDPKPRDEQNIFLNACDVGIVALIPGMLGVSVPSRTYNFCAAGKPILGIAQDGSEIAMLIEENDIGLRVPPLNPEGVRDAILALVNDREMTHRMGRNARAAAVGQFDEGSAVERYREVLILS